MAYGAEHPKPGPGYFRFTVRPFYYLRQYCPRMQGALGCQLDSFLHTPQTHTLHSPKERIRPQNREQLCRRHASPIRPCVSGRLFPPIVGWRSIRRSLGGHYSRSNVEKRNLLVSFIHSLLFFYFWECCRFNFSFCSLILMVVFCGY